MPWLQAPPAEIEHPTERAPAQPGHRKAAPDASEITDEGVVVQR